MQSKIINTDNLIKNFRKFFEKPYVNHLRKSYKLSTYKNEKKRKTKQEKKLHSEYLLRKS